MDLQKKPTQKEAHQKKAPGITAPWKISLRKNTSQRCPFDYLSLRIAFSQYLTGMMTVKTVLIQPDVIKIEDVVGVDVKLNLLFKTSFKPRVSILARNILKTTSEVCLFFNRSTSISEKETEIKFQKKPKIQST